MCDRIRLPLIIFALLATTPTVSCESVDDVDPSGLSHSLVRDSAGIEIVENFIDEASLPLWRLDSVPVIEIGSASGDPSAEFDAVDGAVRLADGTIVIADGGAREIRYFAPDGAHIRTVGGAGEGPGEYRSLIWMRRFAGDSIVAWDGLSRRAHVYSSTGERIRSLDPMHPITPWPDGSRGPGWSLEPIIPARGGGWLSVARADPAKPPGLEIPGYYAHPLLILEHDETGAIVDTVARAPGRMATFLADRTLFAAGAARGFVALRYDSFVIAFSTRPEMRYQARRGALVRIVRFDRRYSDEAYWTWRAEFTEELIRTSRERPLRDARGELFDDEYYRAIFDPPYLREEPPVIGGLEVDASGNIWVRELRHPDDPERSIVFGPDGAARALAEIPRELEVMDRGEDYVLAVRRDDLDVPFVGLWRLLPATPAGDGSGAGS